MLRYLTSDKDKNEKVEHEYPLVIRNSQRLKKKVYSKKEHIDFALLPSSFPLETKLNISKLNIFDLIESEDESWSYINLYYDVQQFGINFFYATIEEIPNIVYWALRFIKQTLNQIEYDKYSKEETKGHKSKMSKEN